MRADATPRSERRLRDASRRRGFRSTETPSRRHSEPLGSSARAEGRRRRRRRCREPMPAVRARPRSPPDITIALLRESNLLGSQWLRGPGTVRCERPPRLSDEEGQQSDVRRGPTSSQRVAGSELAVHTSPMKPLLDAPAVAALLGISRSEAYRELKKMQHAGHRRTVSSGHRRSARVPRRGRPRTIGAGANERSLVPVPRFAYSSAVSSVIVRPRG